MNYVLIILVAGLIIGYEYMQNTDLQSKVDSLQVQVASANDSATRSNQAVENISKADRETIADAQKTIADLHAQMAKIDLRPQITIPAPVVVQGAPVAPPPPAPPPVDIEAVQRELTSVNAKIADTEQDIKIQSNDVAREHPSGYDSYGNYIPGVSHGAASQKLAADNDQLRGLERRKSDLEAVLASGTAGATSTNTFNPGSMNDVTP